MHPNLWRSAKTFPKNKEALRQLLADNEIDIAFAFSPAEASNAIANNELPDTGVAASFAVFSAERLATRISWPSLQCQRQGSSAGLRQFLISPEAQLDKQDPAIWGIRTFSTLMPFSTTCARHSGQV
ncbi:MAG: hypothetical protein R3D29_01700 [Nitratireductor sp.]